MLKLIIGGLHGPAAGAGFNAIPSPSGSLDDPLGHLPAPPPPGAIPSTRNQARRAALSIERSARRLARLTGVEADQWRRVGDLGSAPMPGGQGGQGGTGGGARGSNGNGSANG